MVTQQPLRHTGHVSSPFPSPHLLLWEAHSSLSGVWKGRGKLAVQNRFPVDESTPEQLGGDHSCSPRLLKAPDWRKWPRRGPYRFDLGDLDGRLVLTGCRVTEDRGWLRNWLLQTVAPSSEPVGAVIAGWGQDGRGCRWPCSSSLGLGSDSGSRMRERGAFPQPLPL